MPLGVHRPRGVVDELPAVGDPNRPRDLLEVAVRAVARDADGCGVHHLQRVLVEYDMYAGRRRVLVPAGAHREGLHELAVLEDLHGVCKRVDLADMRAADGERDGPMLVTPRAVARVEAAQVVGERHLVAGRPESLRTEMHFLVGVPVPGA